MPLNVSLIATIVGDLKNCKNCNSKMTHAYAAYYDKIQWCYNCGTLLCINVGEKDYWKIPQKEIPFNCKQFNDKLQKMFPQEKIEFSKEMSDPENGYYHKLIINDMDSEYVIRDWDEKTLDSIDYPDLIMKFIDKHNKGK